MSSMGMDKSGQQTIPGTNTWTKVTTWVARSGFPATVITNNTIVMDGAQTGRIDWLGTFVAAAGTLQVRVVKNATTVIGTATNTGVTGSVAGVTVAPGDTFELQALSSSFAAFLNGGSTNTYLTFTQTSTAYTIGGSTIDTWSSTADLTQGSDIDAEAEIDWNAAASVGLGGPVGVESEIDWNATADIYQGQHYQIDAESTIEWTSEANLLLTPKIVAPPSVFSFADVSATVHTVDGRLLGEFPCRAITTFKWGRERSEVSTATLTVSTQYDSALIESLRQWVHWVTIWHDDLHVWTGPIMDITIGRASTSISMRDPSTFAWRTRVPMTRTFTDTSPARIAEIVWRSMNQLHGIHATPFVIPGIVTDTFTVAAVADAKMLNSFIDDLVKVGLVWTVVAGRPILGVFPTDPVAELAECDFMVELQRRRDGTNTFNDVRVQGANFAATAITDLGGLHLQTIMSIDDLSGAANIQRAAVQQAQKLGTLRDELVIPASASLHPQAPVTVDDLIPGKCFIVHTDTISQVMVLDQVDVNGGQDSFDVQVSLVALPQTGDATLTGGAAV